MLGRGRGWGGALSLVFYVKLQNDQILVSLTSYFFSNKLSQVISLRKMAEMHESVPIHRKTVEVLFKYTVGE